MDRSVVGDDEPEPPPPPPPAVSLKKIIQTRIRPISLMNANVRRSSLGLPTKSLPGGQRVVSPAASVASGQSQAIPGPSSSQEVSNQAQPAEDNHAAVVKADGKEENGSSISSSASQGFSVIFLEQSPLAEQPSSKKLKKRGIIGRIISRSGSKKSSSASSVSGSRISATDSSVSTVAGIVNEELEISVIQTIKQNGSENEHNSNENGSEIKMRKKKPKFPKVMLCFRRLRKAVVMRGKNIEGNETIEEVPESMEMEEKVDPTTAEGSEKKEPRMSERIGNTNDGQDINGQNETSVAVDDIVAAATAVRGTDFVVTIETDEPVQPPPPIQQKQRKVKGSKRGHGGLLEWTLNLKYYTGLSPFRFDGRGRIVSTPLSKAAFLTLYGNAILHSIGQVHIQYSELQRQGKTTGDKAYWYILVFYHMAVTMHLIRLFKCLWFNRKGFRRTIKAERRCSLTNIKSAKYVAVAGRIWSTLVSLICAFGGFSYIHQLAAWSFHSILRICESELFYGLLNTASDDDTPTATEISTIIGENYTSNDPFFNVTQASNRSNQNVTDFVVGWFIHDGELETSILGSIGLFMNFCYQSVLSSGPEIMLSSITSLWLGTRGLQLDEITMSQRGEKTDGENSIDDFDDDDDDDYEDIDTEDEEYTDDQIEAILSMNGKFESLHRLSNKQNDVVKTFWPSLALVILIIMIFVIFGASMQHWFSTTGMTLRIIPVLIGFYLAIKIDQKSDDYHTWFITPRAQKILQTGIQRFQMKMAQMILQPFGFGNGSFFINSAFLGAVFGYCVTYFFMISQSFHANKEKA